MLTNKDYQLDAEACQVGSNLENQCQEERVEISFAHPTRYRSVISTCGFITRER
jgi:hypothetical protein